MREVKTMPIIPNFPAELLEEHRNWHRAHHMQMMNPGPGYGFEFLEFHRNFIGRALNWYAASGFDRRLVEPWTTVPEPIRQSYCYNRPAEERLMLHPESFRSADELGLVVVASGIHGCIHEQAAQLFGEPELDDFDFAARYTTFYRIHGMIDQWYRNWESLGRFREGVTHWCGRFDSVQDEVLYYRPQDETWWLGLPHRSEMAGSRGIIKLEWSMAGSSRSFGPMDDGRPIRLMDLDGDGRSEIVFYDPSERAWRQGRLIAGRIHWEQIPIAIGE